MASISRSTVATILTTSPNFSSVFPINFGTSPSLSFTIERLTEHPHFDLSKSDEEREKEKLASKVKDVAENFYNVFYKKLINDINEESNKYYSKMTELNKAVSGKVKVDDILNEVYTIDENGVRLHNINQANKVSLQISFIAAILSVSSRFWDRKFPFIADAPISALGGDNKVPAIKTMIDIFDQSILLLKDDTITSDIESVRKDPVRELVRNSKNITNGYELIMSDGKKVMEQYTIIKSIK